MLVQDSHTDTKLAVKKMNLHRQQKRDLLVNEVVKTYKMMNFSTLT